MRINHRRLMHGALFLASAFLAACNGGGDAAGSSPATTYTIGGTVTGLTSGTVLVLRNNGGGDLSISADGSFTFATAQASGTTYAVTVKTQPSGQTCTVASSSGTVATTNVTTVAVTCVAGSTFTIGGTVTGLTTGTVLVLRNNGGGDLSISANGSFTFATSQASGTTYSVTVQTQPSGQTCTVSASSGTVSAANVANIAVSCTAGTLYTIGGSVTGLNGTVVLQNKLTDNLSISADGSFTFATPLAGSDVYQVTVLTPPAGQTCTVTNGVAAVNYTNVTSVAVACSTNTYTIGGSVSGLTGTGLELLNNSGDNLTVLSGATAFTFGTKIASGATYNVTVLTPPSSPTQICTVNSPSGTVAASDVTSVAVICSANPYPIGGSITGLNGTGLVLQNNGDDNNHPAAADPSYTFITQLAEGSTYNVTVLIQPSSPAQICTVANAAGTVPAAAVTDANVTCVNTYTIGGSITGAAAGIGPTLQNNLGDNLFIPSIPASPATQSFTFSTPLLDGATYSVTQRIRARAPAQDCSAITGGSNGNGTGTVSGANVNVSITCVPSTAAPKFAFATNSTANTAAGAADTVSAFTIDGTTGMLTAATPPTAASGDRPYAIAVDPVGQFAYAVNSNSDSISAYSIDSGTGVLTALTDASIATGDNPISLAVHPSGKFAYVANQLIGTPGTLSAYSVNSTSGALTAIDADGATAGTQASIATGTSPYAVAVDPLGKFAYVANYGSNTISAYTIDQTSGALAAIGAPVAAGTGPSSIAIEASGKCALAANNSSNDLTSYSINPATGALTLVTTTTAVAGSAPRSVAVDPNTGLYAYVANAGSGSVSAYSVDSATCAIAPIDSDFTTSGFQASIAAGSVPLSVNIDLSGQFVYVANYGSNNLSVYLIRGSGELEWLQTMSNGAGPTSITSTQ